MRLLDQRDFSTPISDFLDQYTPAAPHFFKWLHRNEGNHEPDQLDLTNRLLLCDELSALYEFQHTPTWRLSRDFFYERQWGTGVAMSYYDSIGISNDHGRIVYSRESENIEWIEFMDLDSWPLVGASDEMRGRVKQALHDTWYGFEQVKRGLRLPGAPYESPSLLVKPAIDEAINVGNRCVWKEDEKKVFVTLGMSEDEVWGLEKKGFIVIGLTTSYSPTLRTMINTRAWELPDLDSPDENIDTSKLQEGCCYVMKRDSTKRLPFADNSVVVLASFTGHHFRTDLQIPAVRDMLRIAKPIDDGKAVILNEDSGSSSLLVLQDSLNRDHPVTACDALTSYWRGAKFLKALKRSRLPLSYTEVPSIPFARITRFGMSPMNTLVTGYTLVGSR